MGLHESVLCQEAVDGLSVKAQGIYVDGTLGRAGHSKAILRRCDDCFLYGIDKDPYALRDSCQILDKFTGRFKLLRGDFREMKSLLADEGVCKVDGILLDLGVSSPQFDDPDRGFSYHSEARLDMRMDLSQDLDAEEVINTYTQNQLQEIFSRYGEEPYSKTIAKAIVESRATKPLITTLDLVNLIRQTLPDRVLSQKGHPARRVFQALRIEVNGELEALKEILKEGPKLLKDGGRMVIITFHSLEDRMVKQAFQTCSKPETVDKRIPLRDSEMLQSGYRVVNRKPITASEAEIANNRRARSAKLRILEKKEV
ncbi:MAG: 16S rRNA (cytosine(1402)-N(4))-methyltransferase RsmH [Erysipelotrichaceae bacterium]|jgi:16S rRNA (cytosine1402-N4)-methyltransferase|nr:16S rRNA (cytosine(1402)-N(4))-methyltransferase RsmH [Erysipelotrichaceae bacterium]